jgi:hypothetical protein
MEHLDHLGMGVLQALCDDFRQAFQDDHPVLGILLTQGMELIALDAVGVALLQADG